jgi:hypothetical protein
MTRDLARRSNKETAVNKKLSRLQISDITATKKRLGQRELSEAQLKLVGGGVVATEGGTCTICPCDCDE